MFGQTLGLAPIVLVNHALTGNSNPVGENGWWKHYIGENKPINTNSFTIIAFNIPGNGYQGNPLINNYKDFTSLDIATIFWKGLDFMQVKNLFAIIGGSLGGSIAWQMTLLRPNSVKNLIPIATHWKASDWVVANAKLQEQILKNSSIPIHDARTHAMLIYRTPQSLKNKFKNTKNNTHFGVESWLEHHAEKLNNRFTIQAYLLMNQLLKTIGFNLNEEMFLAQVQKIKAKIHLISIDSDLLFLAQEILETFQLLKKHELNCTYFEVKSIHGHDAFLMPNDSFENHLSKIFSLSLITIK